MHLVSISKFPPTLFWHSFSGPKNSPCVFQHFFACILMYLHFVSMSRLHPSSINNYLRSSCFNIELSLSPMCPSISCIHCASYVDFPHWPPHHFLRFYCFNTGTSPASTTSCMHLVSVPKNSSHPVPGQKNVHGTQPNVSAYNNGVPLPPYGGKVQEAGARVQKTGNRAQKQLIWLSKKIPLGPAQIHAGPKKISPLGPENAQASPLHFL